MKTLKQYINTNDADRIENLVSLGLRHIEAKPLFGQLIVEMENRNMGELVDAIRTNPDIMEELRSHVEAEMRAEGYTMLKVNEMEKKSKLEEFVNSVLFPYYNEQTQFVLF